MLGAFREFFVKLGGKGTFQNRFIPMVLRPSGGCLFWLGAGREPIAVELSGGQFLPPVQTLVATFIFTGGENANGFRLPAG